MTIPLAVLYTAFGDEALLKRGQLLIDLAHSLGRLNECLLRVQWPGKLRVREASTVVLAVHLDIVLMMTMAARLDARCFALLMLVMMVVGHVLLGLNLPIRIAGLDMSLPDLEAKHRLALVQHRAEEAQLVVVVVAPPLERLEGLLEELLCMVLLVVEFDASELKLLDRSAERREVNGQRRRLRKGLDALE